MRARAKVATVAAGLVLAVAPLLVATAQPAGAAETIASASGSVTFVRSGDGTAVTCSAGVSAVHDTDDATHPFVRIFESAGFGGDHRADCLESVTWSVVVTYKDTGGNTQTSTYCCAFSGATIGGAKSKVTVALTVEYLNCNPDLSATCTATYSASPK
jgi:hypothetical protein